MSIQVLSLYYLFAGCFCLFEYSQSFLMKIDVESNSLELFAQSYQYENSVAF
jgi:hypothetical protein